LHFFEADMMGEGGMVVSQTFYLQLEKSKNFILTNKEKQKQRENFLTFLILFRNILFEIKIGGVFFFCVGKKI